MIRSNMNFMNLGKGEIKVIMVTSSNPHAGKTFVAVNLAATLAMAGKRVLLVDLDFRRHALSSQLGHGGSKHGLTAYLPERSTAPTHSSAPRASTTDWT